MHVVYEGRTCNQTLLVHQEMTKKTTFYDMNYKAIKCMKKTVMGR